MFLENPCLLEWFRSNTEKDEADKVSLINTVLDELKPWLNVELYSNLKKTKKTLSNKKAFIEGLKTVANKDTLDKITKSLENKGI